MPAPLFAVLLFVQFDSMPRARPWIAAAQTIGINTFVNRVDAWGFQQEWARTGTRAWSRQGGAWEELMPAIAQTIIAQVREGVVDPPKDVGEFECLGKATIDGKGYLAYRSVEKPEAAAKGAGGTPVHRTVYVDPATGLPAINIVAEEQGGATPLFKGVYTYPTDLVIEGHPEASLGKVR